MQYLAKHRLNIARKLLQSTDLQVQQIAEKSGFKSATVLCRNFKKEFGQSPRQERTATYTSA
jgi:transcriptional regulator GlxA family with amidase domain